MINFIEKENKNKGFSLIEMLVSIALFSIVVTVAIGSIVTIVDSNRKAQSITIVMNNLNFAIESMTRDIKTADPNSLSSTPGNDSLYVDNSSGDEIEYSYASNKISKTINGVTKSLLSNDIVVEKFYVDVVGVNQPRVFIFLEGYSQITPKTRSDFSIQTTVSPRKLKIN